MCGRAAPARPAGRAGWSVYYLAFSFGTLNQGIGMQALLTFSRLIDAISDRIGKLGMWLILATTLISAGNAVMRKAFDMRDRKSVV